MIRIGGKAIIGGYLGTKAISALYFGLIKVFPKSDPPEPIPGELTLNPQTLDISYAGGIGIITLQSTSNWTASVLQTLN